MNEVICPNLDNWKNEELFEIFDVSDSDFVNKVYLLDEMKITFRKLLALDLDKRVKLVDEIKWLIKNSGYGNLTDYFKKVMSSTSFNEEQKRFVWGLIEQMQYYSIDEVNLTKDLYILENMKEKLKDIIKIKKRYSLLHPVSLFLFILGIVFSIYIGTSVEEFMVFVSFLGTAYFFIRQKKDLEFGLSESGRPVFYKFYRFFNQLTEREVIFLEMMLKKHRKKLKVIKADFHILYQESIELKNLDKNLIIKYRAIYKESEEFTGLLKSIFNSKK